MKSRSGVFQANQIEGSLVNSLPLDALVLRTPVVLPIDSVDLVGQSFFPISFSAPCIVVDGRHEEEVNTSNFQKPESAHASDLRPTLSNIYPHTQQDVMVSPFSICNRTSTDIGTKCRDTSYCSAECVETYWSCHRLLCEQFSDMSDRPSPSHCQAISFPADAETPQLVWLHCPVVTDSEITHQNVEFKGYLGPDGPMVEHKAIYGNVYRDRKALRVECRNFPGMRGSTSNRRLKTATQGRMCYDWREAALICIYK